MPSHETASPDPGTGTTETEGPAPAAGSELNTPETAGAPAEERPSGAEPGASEPTAGASATSPPAPGAAKRRRRRRRRGGGAAATGTSGPPAARPGAEDAGTNEGSTEPAAVGAPVEGAPVDGVDATAPDKKKDARHEGKGRPRKPAEKSREKREPRERPAFGLGDVVFGKIVEITDDAVFVDLSGKGKGIFDRLEMLLPDDVPESPDAPKGGSDGDDARKDDEAPEPAAVATTGDEPPATAEPAIEAETAISGGDESEADVPPTVASGGVEKKTPARRIIVAAGALAVDAAATAPAGEATPEVPAEPADQEAASPAAEGAPAEAPFAGDAPAVEAHAPRPPPYAPPIVLELGAHFVGLVHNDGARGGLIVLTRHPRRASQAKPLVLQALREKTLVKGLVTGTVKGGVEVDVDGLRAFAPGSHMDLRLGSNLSRFIGQRLDFEVTQYGKRGRDVVLSRKAHLEADARVARESALAQLTPGATVVGVVKSVVAFGAFIDVGGVEGLVGLPEMSHNRADTPSDVFKVGERVEVKILRIDDKRKLWLSRKAVSVDPRVESLKKYGVGTRHTGKVVRLQPFGAFVELEPGIDGLIHTPDLSIKRIEHPSEVVKVGDPIDVVVATYDTGSQKIALHPAASGAAAEEAPQRVQIHRPLKVVVVGVEAGGLVVRVLGATGRHARGFITSAATGTPRGTELRKPFPVGTQLDAKVIEIDSKRGEIKLSIKALREDSERNAYQQYRQQVTREAKFGTFGDLLAKKGLVSKE